MERFIVFTGGPGSGKTSVIEHLQSLGYKTADEVGRRVIQQQVESGGSALPWLDKTAFRDAMVSAEIDKYRRIGVGEEFVFFDRSIVDSYGYSLLEDLAFTESLIQHCYQLRYHLQVFVFPPWKEIFANDAERKQDFAEAVTTYEKMREAYQSFGYTLTEVPKGSVEQRSRFVLDALSSR
ncbi:AAA family ATPase [Vibrio sp. RE88]|uniref:AAA family ATPase n=1 Tax=Vibrio sp. RE88 TaxID=2607610 RepID=UPI0014932BC2|nr:AAA family ATPase [Vibrio sp. RE88]NOH63495.1 ATP-binding protein [Vibrio sp. RE88]